MSNERRIVGWALFAITLVILLVWALNQIDATQSKVPDLERLEFEIAPVGDTDG